MSSLAKTTNVGLNQWAGTEYPSRQDFVDDNKKIDDKFGELNNDLSAVESDVADLSATPFELPITLAYGSWVGRAKPYTYVITNSNIDSRDIAVCPGSINDDAVLATSKAMILKVTKDEVNHTLTLYAYGAKPTIDIPILLKLKADLENVVDGTTAQGNILTTLDVINSLNSTSTDLPLSANKGKELNDSITLMGNNLRAKASIRTYFSAQSGRLVSTTIDYMGSDKESLTVTAGAIVGERVLTASEIAKLNSSKNINNRGVDFMTSDAGLLSALSGKIVAIEIG